MTSPSDSPRRAERALTLLLGLVVLCLHAYGPLRTLVQSEWPHLWGISGVCQPQWENIVHYGAEVAQASWTSPIPLAPSFDDSSGFKSVPFLSIWFRKALYVLGGGWDGFFLICATAFPLLAFFLLTGILRRLFPRWPLLAPLCALASLLKAFPMPLSEWKNYHGPSGLASVVNTLQTLNLTRAPSNSLTLTLFLAALWLTIRWTGTKREWAAGAVWALFMYFYVFNAAVGVGAFAIWVTLDAIDSGETLKGWATRAAKAAGAFLVVALPFLTVTVLAMGQAEAEFALRGHFYTRDHGWFLDGPLFYLFPVAMPTALTLAALALRFKLPARTYFFPVLLLGIFGLSQTHMLFGKFLAPSHFQWWFLNYLSFAAIPACLAICLAVAERWVPVMKPWLPRLALAGVAILGTNAIFNRAVQAHVTYLAQEARAVPEMRRVEGLLNELVDGTTRDERLVSEDQAVNILLPVVADRKTLLLNPFQTRMLERDILETHFALAKMIGWDAEQAVISVGYDADKNVYGTPVRYRETPGLPESRLVEDFYFSKDYGPVYAGFLSLPNWAPEHAPYDRAGAKKRFEALDVAAALKRYNVTRVQSRAIHPDLEPLVVSKSESEAEPGIFLYRLDPARL